MAIVLDFVFVILLFALAWLASKWKANHVEAINMVNRFEFVKFLYAKAKVLLMIISLMMTILVSIASFRLHEIFAVLKMDGVSAWSLIFLYFIFIWWNSFFFIHYKLLISVKSRFYP